MHRDRFLYSFLYLYKAYVPYTIHSAHSSFFLNITLNVCFHPYAIDRNKSGQEPKLNTIYLTIICYMRSVYTRMYRCIL